MAMVPQFLLVFPLWLFSLQTVAGCLQCDRRFLDSVATLLTETLPADLPDRDTLIERHIQALADLHGTFLQKTYERVLDVRGVMSIKSHVISQLRGIKSNNTWKGVFMWQLSMYQLRVSLRSHMQQTLEKFADLGTNPEGKAVIEGPVLDCWTCLRIVTQCFDGEVCGVEDRRFAEYNEVVLYIFFVCESVLMTSAALVYWVFFKHKKEMLQKALAR
ncbi:izumo sperm-egg fusion protein 3 [Rhineura floridana]|uniref:izumo sperm-egg fusion protein 3 n=1 Tax=Rhineura floridana TaxID=261503 RepID=UPI002AC87758|nr:izumo sperm-egg fusion protein 3 [Rhineura floridana]